MAEMLSNLSFAFYMIAIAFLVVAVLMFVFLQIPKVIGDLSGRTARKSIKKMRMVNENTGNKSYRPSSVNKDRGKVTGTIPDNSKNAELPGTGIISENKAEKHETEATALLVEDTADVGGTNAEEVKRTPKIKLKIIDEVMFVHTDEVIG